MANKRILLIALGVFALGATTIAACSSSDDNPAPGNNTTDSGIPTVDSGTTHDTTPTDTGATTDSGTPSDGGDTGTVDAADTTPWDAESGTCFPGAPTTNLEYLNACTTSSCQSFDNKTRCPKLNPDGTLPPLP